MKKQIGPVMVVLLAGCATTHGTYRSSVVDASGKDLAPGIALTATGSGIYAARNGMCAANPGATVQIIDIQTGTPLAGESPYTCRK
ncbi:hypothetical protein [Dyella sp. C9]|uniref:hypothetical protein n=1 Tax=Dyella sp. C9 TaxID=2202154 RepID=UPI000DEF58C8|nr:hypothetical protein [Dyella sp. C9]